MNNSNLTPFSLENRERAVEMARKGGIASGIAKREKKMMTEGLKMILPLAIDAKSQYGKNILALARQMGIELDEVPIYQAANWRQVAKALSGDTEAWKAIRDTIGEKPKEEIDIDGNMPPPFVIGLHNAEYVEEERKKNAERIAEALAARETIEAEVMDSASEDKEEPSPPPPPSPSQKPPPSAHPTPPSGRFVCIPTTFNKNR